MGESSSVILHESRESVLVAENKEKAMANIGILSVSDYYLAYNEDRTWGGYSPGKNNWLYIQNNGSTQDYGG